MWFCGVLWSIDRQKAVCSKSSDFGAALDKCFLDKLKSEFGVIGSTRMWLESYFRDSYHSVYINISSSTSISLMTGFPQGCVIRPNCYCQKAWHMYVCIYIYIYIFVVKNKLKHGLTWYMVRKIFLYGIRF